MTTSNSSISLETPTNNFSGILREADDILHKLRGGNPYNFPEVVMPHLTKLDRLAIRIKREAVRIKAEQVRFAGERDHSEESGREEMLQYAYSLDYAEYRLDSYFDVCTLCAIYGNFLVEGLEKTIEARRDILNRLDTFDTCCDVINTVDEAFAALYASSQWPVHKSLIFGL